MRKGIAIIIPSEDITNKDYAFCEVEFIDQKNNHKKIKTTVTTSIFKYHFYGASIEYIELDNAENVVDVRDLNSNDCKEFDISVSYALTLSNGEDIDSLATNGFIYKLSQSTFYKKYPEIMHKIFFQMARCDCFALQYILVNGAVGYIQLLENPKPKSALYKYRMKNGYVIEDREILNCFTPKTISDFEAGNTILSQREIDKLLEKLNYS